MTAGQDRLAGYKDALKAEGIRPSRKLIIEGDFTMAGGVRDMRRLLRTVPDIDGVFAASDLMAVGAMQALDSLGRRIPEDVAVIGFDDVPAALIAHPPLTTVRQPIEEMGRQLARCLLDRIEGKPTKRRIVLPTELVRRASA
jgi:DNA-binding LacI/PurR family transcriptional regulator